MEKMINGIIRGVGSIWSIVIHTILFLLSFCFYFFGFGIDRILLVLTTVVSLEAIYLSLLIQISVNIQGKKVEEIRQDIEDIQDDIEEIQEED